MPSNSKASELIKFAQNFAKHDIYEYLKNPEAESSYPRQLVSQLSAAGLFGFNIPEKYDGYLQDPPTTLRIIQELAAGWLSIPAIIGSHMRAASYFLNCGTEAQALVC